MVLSRERSLRGVQLPPALGELPQPPDAMYLRGELPRGPRVAIVGTRRPTREAALYAFELAARLAQEGVAVLSGGAVGIDSMAHRGALAVGGSTVVVAPGGFERPFPPEHRELFRQIVEQGGAYLSLASSTTPASRSAFFARNACLVALCHAVVVVEAPVRSGARNAAARARQLGRPLFVAPAAPYNRRGLGCILELKLGGRPLYSQRDVLELLAEARLHAIPLPAGEIDPAWLAREARSALVACRSPRCGHGAAFTPACAPSRAREGACVPARQPALAKSDDCAPGLEAGAAPRRRRGGSRHASRLHSRQQMLKIPADSLSDTDAVRVLEAVRAGAACPDEVCSRTGLAAARVQELLLTLTLRGVLAADLAGRLKVVSS